MAEMPQTYTIGIYSKSNYRKPTPAETQTAADNHFVIASVMLWIMFKVSNCVQYNWSLQDAADPLHLSIISTSNRVTSISNSQRYENCAFYGKSELGLEKSSHPKAV